eukprot:CAMPEP_0168625400 /NCGR_PEP_ID=MMETSP0449_2-20121227/9983_1 /TAXON_ID=1082188 /ORGANISM="Strombidium rassoulzadegani, Strain ras09" /LENGTH=58 /DNA_ID=CAMNT_0008667135 /DNA_START=44 /DNA_END=216 /DNA_ORIENTATION=-
MLRLVCWYQKKALMGFLGALASFFLRVFFSGFSSLTGFLALAFEADLVSLTFLGLALS